MSPVPAGLGIGQQPATVPGAPQGVAPAQNLPHTEDAVMLDEAAGQQPLALHAPEMQTENLPTGSRVEMGPSGDQQQVSGDNATSGSSVLEQQQQGKSADGTVSQSMIGSAGLQISQAPMNPPEQSAQEMLRASNPFAAALAQRPPGEMVSAQQAPRPAMPMFSNAGLPPPVQLPTSLLSTRPSTPASSHHQVSTMRFECTTEVLATWTPKCWQIQQ